MEINQFLAKLSDSKTKWPKQLLVLRDRLIKLEKLTNSDAINTASNPH